MAESSVALTETDLSDLEPPSKGKKRDWSSSEDEGRIGKFWRRFAVIWVEESGGGFRLCVSVFEWLSKWPPEKLFLTDLTRRNQFLVELEPPSSGESSSEIQLCSASVDNSGCLVVNLRTDPLPSLFQFRDKVSQAIYLRGERTIFGNLPGRTDQSFVTQLSYIKKNNMDPLLLKSTPEAEESTPEAEDLRLLKNNLESRPEGEVFLHPYFWSSEVKLYFLCEFSDRLQLKDPAPHPNLLKELESNEPPVFVGNWIDKIDDPNLKADILARAPKSRKGIRRYTSSVEMLLRVVRNKHGHYWALQEDIQKLLGGREEGLYSYFAAQFPSLLMNSYRAASQYCGQEEWFKEFHRKTGLLLK